MFKSFSHEIKTPLNGVIFMLDRAKGILKKVLDRGRQSEDLITVQNHMISIESGVLILKNNLNDLIVKIH